LRVLLTGGTGFVGKNLISYLTSKQISVDNLSREILKNDKKLDNFFKDKQSDLNQNFDVLIHLAAELDSSSKQLVPVNVSLTKKLLDLCVKSDLFLHHPM